MSDTPRTNRVSELYSQNREYGTYILAEHSRQLERELSAANARIAELEKAIQDAGEYHRVMELLRNARMEHGLCKPRERRACTACNAKDDLEKLISEYRGAPVVLMTPN